MAAAADAESFPDMKSPSDFRHRYVNNKRPSVYKFDGTWSASRLTGTLLTTEAALRSYDLRAIILMDSSREAILCASVDAAPKRAD